MMPETLAEGGFGRAERPDDLSMPRPPRPAYFDSASETWVLSRYADVFTALQDSRLRPAGHKPKDGIEADPEAQTSFRSETQRALSAALLSEWQQQMEQLARGHAAALPSDRPVDLVGEFAEPWCASIALIVTGASAKDGERLMELARLASAAAADPDNPDLKKASAAAGSELERMIPSGPIPMPAAAFVALAQTLPAFLARAWLALLRHPGELSKLHSVPGLLPGALEELLRYAGVARRISRIAHTSLEFGGLPIAAGQSVRLELTSANRDPDQFAEPNRLDVMRLGVRHLAMGAGLHSCAGAPLIRLASAVATTAFVQRFHPAAVCEPVDWRGGAVFRAPAAVRVHLYGASPQDARRPFLR